MKLTLETAVNITSAIMHLLHDEVTQVSELNNYLQVMLSDSVAEADCKKVAESVLSIAQGEDEQTTAWVHLHNPRNILLVFED